MVNQGFEIPVVAWRHEAFVPLEGSVFPDYVAGGMLAERLRVAEHANPAEVLPDSHGIDGEVVDEKLQEFCGEGLSLQQYFKIPSNEISTADALIPICLSIRIDFRLHPFGPRKA